MILNNFLSTILEKSLSSFCFHVIIMASKGEYMTIKMNTVKSTSISEIGYKRRTMHVRFVNGKLYELKKVPRAEFDTFLKSPSKGQHFLREFKSHYPSVQLTCV